MAIPNLLPPRLPTFIPWLKKQKHRDDPVGDLARDVRRDIKYSHAKIASHESLAKRICYRGSCAAAAALEMAKVEYDALLLPVI